MSASLAQVRAAVAAAADAVRGEGAAQRVGVGEGRRGAGAGEGPLRPALERSRRAGQGDYATNAAMLLAPLLGRSAREIAPLVAEQLRERLGPWLAACEVAGPGFLNLTLSDGFYRAALRELLALGDRHGAGGASPAERILLEFVSANPTAPLVVASGRHAAYGDALARILAHHGHSVWREYYFNDAGNQIRLLGESVILRARGQEVPAGEGYYEGDYVGELAARIPHSGAADADVASVAAAAVELMLGEIVATLQRYGVRYDRFFSERTLHEGSPSAVARTLAMLREAGHVYDADGAVWLRTSAFGDDKDRVVIRSDGTPTYLAADVAYIQDKRERGFDRQLMPVGADHHAYVGELKAAMAALGGDPETIEVPIIQFVHLVSAEGTFRMSKRRGHFVTLEELIDAIGVDACRYFLVSRSQDHTIELDVALAQAQSAENPVYYIQYAHARTASMLGRLAAERVAEGLAAEAAWHEGGLHPSERALIQRLIALPEEVAEAAARRAPHRIAAYALELAREFSAFYRDCRVVGATPRELESFRIALARGAQTTIRLSLELLGVSAPDSM
jgi:arginyl-tRNA synthetase